jgi:hypothetical protein
MNLLAPWALAAGAVIALGVIAAHFIARDVPPRWLLPTARFIPAARTDVLTRSVRPRDPLLMMVRIALVMTLAIAAADPARWWRSRARAEVIVADLSRSTGDRAAVLRHAREQFDDGDIVVRLDTIARIVDVSALDTTPLPRTATPGRLGAALLVALDAAHTLQRSADSVSLTFISAIATEQFDAATDSIRGMWPKPITLLRVAAASTPTTSGARAFIGDANDPLRESLAATAGDASVRVVRGALTAVDSSHAARGGTVVWWPAQRSARDSAFALLTRSSAVVAPLARRTLDDRERAVAWWSDGTPAATEQPLGLGCLRTVGVVVPTTGDVVISPRFRESAVALSAPCGLPAEFRSAADAVAQRFAQGPRAARTMQRADVVDHYLIRAALGVALLLMLLEAWLRRPLRP